MENDGFQKFEFENLCFLILNKFRRIKVFMPSSHVSVDFFMFNLRTFSAHWGRVIE